MYFLKGIIKSPRFLVTTPLLLCFLLFSFFASAEDSTSTNFIIRGNLLDDSGGNSTSTSYDQFGALGQTAVGESTSTNFIVQSGLMYFNSFSPATQNWRWYSDTTNETPVTALAAENTAPTAINSETAVKIRITIKETGGISQANQKFKLQFSKSSDFSTGVTDVAGLGSCYASSRWCYTLGGGIDNAVITTKVLSDADSCSSSTGNGCGTHNTSGTTTSTFTFPAGAATEFEFTIKNSGAEYNTAYFFRVYDVTNDVVVVLNSGASYPSLTTNATTLSFSVAGLPSGTVTEGVTTDVTTTATAISFGTLPIGTPVAAAQRLTASTNAAYGYTTYVFQTQPLTRVAGSVIDPITGTNASPAVFGIAGGSNGGYGYHTSDHQLGTEVTTRFSTNNTYAQYDGTSREIAFSSVATSSDVTDIITKIQVTGLQAAGNYSTSIIYVIVPIF
jgi:hypothetical protein